MKILVTGAKGFVGRNLCSQLNNIKDGKARWYGGVQVEAVYEYDLGSTPEQLDQWCRDGDFVFNLAGVNRPKNQEEFMEGNFGFASTLLNTLKKYKNNCPVMISSSIQATLAGRFGTSEYGKSKKAGEELMFEYGKETGAKVLVYRFPKNFFGFCRIFAHVLSMLFQHIIERWICCVYSKLVCIGAPLPFREGDGG